MEISKAESASQLLYELNAVNTQISKFHKTASDCYMTFYGRDNLQKSEFGVTENDPVLIINLRNQTIIYLEEKKKSLQRQLANL